MRKPAFAGTGLLFLCAESRKTDKSFPKMLLALQMSDLGKLGGRRRRTNYLNCEPNKSRSSNKVPAAAWGNAFCCGMNNNILSITNKFRNMWVCVWNRAVLVGGAA